MKVAIDDLQKSDEGQLRGGFAVIGSGTPDSTFRIDAGTCVNDGCTNTVPECDKAVNANCVNKGCKPTSPVSGNSNPSIGATFAL